MHGPMDVKLLLQYRSVSLSVDSNFHDFTAVISDQMTALSIIPV